MERNTPVEEPPISISLVLVILFLGFVVLGPMIGFMLALPFYNGSLMELAAAVGDPLQHVDVKISFFIIQGSATFLGLIIAPALLLYLKGNSVYKLVHLPKQDKVTYFLTVVMTLLFMIGISPVIEWNASVTFPDFLSGVESWARTREDFATEVTAFLTTFHGTGELLLGLLVIAVLPAIGEEFVFRGIIQKQLHRNMNIHVAIWVSAALFSAIHLQFFGFIPRMLLGVLFGYLYYWSGNVWIPVLAHFFNNGFSVLMLYFYQQGLSSVDMNSTEAAPWPIVGGAIILFSACILIFKAIISKS